VVELREQIDSDALPTNSQANEPLPDWRRHWRALGQSLAPNHLPLSQLIKQCTVHKISPDSLTIRTKYRFHIDKLNDRKNKRLLEDQLEKLGGRSIKLIMELDNTLAPLKKARLQAPSEPLSSDTPLEPISPEVAAQVFQATPVN
jgi:hypothetical protein